MHLSKGYMNSNKANTGMYPVCHCFCPKLDSNSVPLVVTVCEPSALPSELWEGVDRAAHACMASVD